MTSKRPTVAFLDANVLYSAAIRDIMMELALAQVYRAKWSEDVQREWFLALLRNRPDLDRANLERTRHLMDKAIPDASVTGYMKHVDSIQLQNDPSDRHIIAAAIVGKCDVIVTQNVTHFPQHMLMSHNLEAQHPDEFLAIHLDLQPGSFCAAVRIARVTKKGPPYTVEEYLSNLSELGLDITVAGLRQYARLLA